jgi:hypothetical protein
LVSKLEVGRNVQATQTTAPSVLLITAYCVEEHFTNDHDTAVASPSAPVKTAFTCNRYWDDRVDEYEYENEHSVPVQFASVSHGTLSLHTGAHCNDGSCTWNVAS